MGSFTTETDFQNGTWIDGEFYASEERRGGHKKRTKEEAMLGVFGSDSDEDDRRGGGGGGGRSKKPMANRPVSFVSKGSTSSSLEPPEAAASADAPARERKKGKLFGQRPAAPPTSMAPPEPPASNMPAEKVDKDFGAFEQHTKGFGLKMLEKMGWSKGQAVGKRSQGVVNPLEAKLRPASMGMGYGGFKETTSKAKLQQKRILHEGDGAQHSDDSDEERERKKQQAQAPPGERPKNWKKHERRQLNLKSAAERREQLAAAAAAPPSAPVLDMRGPQVRLHASMGAAAAAAPADTEPPPPAILPELSHNLALLVDLDDLELAKRERALKQERDALAALTQRRDALASAARQRSASLAKLSDVRDALADCATAAAAAAAGDCDALADAAERWARLRAAAPAEFAEWRLHELALSAVAPGARALYAAWTPLEQPALGVEAMRRWQRALAPLPGGGGARRESSSGGPSGGPELAYEALIHCVVLPPVRSALVNGWAVREPDAAAALLERWRPLLPGSQFSTLIATQVLPRLEAELGRWQPKHDATPPHTWLHPWLPLLPPPGLAPLFPQIRHKLGALLEATHAKAGGGLAAAAPGAAARAALSPWRRVLDGASWEALLTRHVVPMLAASLQAVRVNPADQELDGFVGVLAWTELVGAEAIASALLRLFFPGWLRALRLWLQQAADYDEVSRWYLGWKQLIADKAPPLLQHEGVRLQLNTALDMLNAALAAAEAPPPPPPGAEDDAMGDLPPPPPPPDDGAPPPPPPPDAPSLSGSRWSSSAGAAPVEPDFMVDLSLRESLERLAADREIVFMPTGARQDGKQVFSFGGVPLYLDPDKALVYARLGKAGFKPTSLRALVDAASN